MASAISQGFHTQLMAQERDRVMLRIQQGTKASSPQTLMMKRLKPLYYSNPLPDNSSGSKIRMFFENKDESGRPNAMELVAMRQQMKGSAAPSTISGGVLKNFKYARKILNQRARDTTNIRLATEGLPEIPSPILALNPEESMNMELNSLITNLQNAIESQTLDQLTINEVKNIPRLLVSLSLTFTEEDVANLMNIVEGMQNDLENINTAPSQRLFTFLADSMEPFLKGLVDTQGGKQAIVFMEPQNREPAVRALARRFFGNISFRAPKAAPAAVPAAPAAAVEPEAVMNASMEELRNIHAQLRQAGLNRAELPNISYNTSERSLRNNILRALRNLNQ